MYICNQHLVKTQTKKMEKKQMKGVSDVKIEKARGKNKKGGNAGTNTHRGWVAACTFSHAARAHHGAGRTMWQPDRVSLLGYCTAGARSYELVQDACL